MTRRCAHLALAAATIAVGACADENGGRETRLTGSTVEYGRVPSGAPLRGVLYRPKGPGPFPVLLYAHGSAPRFWSNDAFEAVAPAFTSRGWAVFAPYRRGQGLSADAGPFVRDEIAAARRAGGGEEAQARLARLLATDQMDDQSQAFRWLSHQPFAAKGSIAVMGNSFGGIVALLSAERLEVCAAVNASGGAESWNEAPALRALMTRAASEARAPVLFMQARNDFSLEPSRVLAAVMRGKGKAAELRLYPPFGSTAPEGHAAAYKGVAVWAPDVHRFLERACRQRPHPKASNVVETRPPASRH